MENNEMSDYQLQVIIKLIMNELKKVKSEEDLEKFIVDLQELIDLKNRK